MAEPVRFRGEQQINNWSVRCMQITRSKLGGQQYVANTITKKYSGSEFN